MPTHSQKIEAALVAYLSNFSGATWPDSLTNDDGNKRIFAGEDDETKDGQCIICVMDDMQEEFPEKSGNRYSLCRVELRTPFYEGDEDTPIEDHESAAVQLETCMVWDEMATLLTSAVPNFTVMGVLDRQPIEEETPEYWMAGYTFRLYSCPKSFP